MKRHLFSAILIIMGLAALTGASLFYQRSADARESTGIVAQITGVAIGEDKIPVVTFTLADDQGNLATWLSPAI